MPRRLNDWLRKPLHHFFENALIGRLFRSSGEVRTSENAVLMATELIETIDAYLGESNQ